jgi:hypothetical protein
MNEQEIERIFSAIDPAAGLDNDGLDSVFDADALMRRVTVGIRSDVPIKTGRRWRRFRRGFTVPLALLLVASGTAAAVSLLRSPEPIRLSALMDCYSQPMKRASVIDVVELTTTPGQTCVHVLRAALNNGAAMPSFAPPALCVSNDDLLRVFPTTHVKNFCNTLGFAPYSGKVIVDHVARLMLAAHAFNASHQCASVQVATADANKLLSANSLARSWNVHVDNRAAPTCATLAVDDVHRILDVVPIPLSFSECGGSDIKVLIAPPVIVRSDQSAYRIRVVNESDAFCALVDYADVTMLGSGSTRPLVASHAPNRPISGSPPGSAATLPPLVFVAGRGGEASFLLVFTATSTSCVIQYQNLSVRINGDLNARALRLPTPIHVCVPPLVTVFATGSRGPSQ